MKRKHPTMSQKLFKTSSYFPGRKHKHGQVLFHRFSMEMFEHSKIGPGSYNLRLSTLGGPTFEFPRSTRFTKSSIEMNRNRLKTSSSEKVIRNNKEMTRYQPKIKKDLLKQKARNNRERAKNIHVRKREESEKRLTTKIEKLKRTEWIRQFKTYRKEYLQIVKAWSILISIFAVPSVLLNRTILKCIKKDRCQQFLKFWAIISRTLGKFKLLLRKIRNKKTKRAISRINPLAKSWKKRLRAVKTRILLGVVNDYIVKKFFFRFALNFRGNIVYIQTRIRQLILDKKQCLQARMICWDLIAEKLEVKTTHSVKRIAIKNEIKRRLRDYNERIKKYQKECRFARNSYSMIHAVLPKRPLPYYHISNNQYRAMIKGQHQLT